MAVSSEETKSLELKNSCSKFIQVPLCFQETEYTCGVACVQSILAGFDIIYRQDVLEDMLKTKPIYGTEYQNILNLFHMLGFQASFHYGMTLTMVKDYIKNGITPILMIQAWKSDNIDYTYDWKDSHYTIACGYEDDRILFMDPYTIGNYTYISNDELIKRWHTLDEGGTHYFNSALIISSDSLPFCYNPQLIKHQE